MDLQRTLLAFISSSDMDEENYQNLLQLFNNQNIHQNRIELIKFLNLLVHIANNHNRSPVFFDKIIKILSELMNDIKQTFSDMMIFSIFKSNKRLLLHIFDEEIIKLNSKMVNIIHTDEYERKNYPSYFYPEIMKFNNEKKIVKCEMQLNKMKNAKKHNELQSIIDLYNKNPEVFLQKRKTGENTEDEIYLIIRNDDIDNFLLYVDQTKYNLESKIKLSIFETNSYLIDKTPNLIEYASFFGSIKIFKYLAYNGINLTSSIWMYAIHGCNPEIFIFLEEKKIQPQSYEKCKKEAIMCHHISIADYIASIIASQNENKIESDEEYEDEDENNKEDENEDENNKEDEDENNKEDEDENNKEYEDENNIEYKDENNEEYEDENENDKEENIEKKLVIETNETTNKTNTIDIKKYKPILNVYLSRLNKKQIITLPGFEDKQQMKAIELKSLLKQYSQSLEISKKRGITVNDYITNYEPSITKDKKLNIQEPKTRIHKPSKPMEQTNPRNEDNEKTRKEQIDNRVELKIKAKKIAIEKLGSEAETNIPKLTKLKEKIYYELLSDSTKYDKPSKTVKQPINKSVLNTNQIKIANDTSTKSESDYEKSDDGDYYDNSKLHKIYNQINKKYPCIYPGMMENFVSRYNQIIDAYLNSGAFIPNEKKRIEKKLIITKINKLGYVNTKNGIVQLIKNAENILKIYKRNPILLFHPSNCQLFLFNKLNKISSINNLYYTDDDVNKIYDDFTNHMSITLIENLAKKAKDFKYEDWNKINNETNEKTNLENTDKEMSSMPNEEEEEKFNKFADELSKDGKSKPKTAVKTQEEQAKIDVTTVKRKAIKNQKIDDQKAKEKPKELKVKIENYNDGKLPLNYKQVPNNEPISQLPKTEDKSLSEVESSASFGKPSKPRIIQQPKSFNNFLNSDFDAELASDEYD